MPHVLVAGRIHEAGVALLKAAPGVTFDLVDEVSTESYLPYLTKADAVLIRTQPMPASAIAAAPGLKIVSRHGVGYDAVDVSALNARGIPLAIVGDVNSRAVAEHAMMMMLAAARRTVRYDRATRDGCWQVRNSFEIVELDGKTLFLLGFGRIGRRLGALAQAFGMTVLAHDPFVPSKVMEHAGVIHVRGMNEALGQADFISLHMPPSPGGPLIGDAQIAVMKPSAIVINTARGGLVDEKALDLALRENRLAGAALDVFAEEPPRPGQPLLANDKVTISPHNAGLTQECAARMAVASVQNILSFFAGELDKTLIVNADQLGVR